MAAASPSPPCPSPSRWARSRCRHGCAAGRRERPSAAPASSPPPRPAATIADRCSMPPMPQNPLLSGATVTDRSGGGGAQPPAAGGQAQLPAPPPRRRKVPFEKGFSQMDWVRLTQTHPDLAGLGGGRPRRGITLDEVARHATQDDCWTVLRGRVGAAAHAGAAQAGGHGRCVGAPPTRTSAAAARRAPLPPSPLLASMASMYSLPATTMRLPARSTTSPITCGSTPGACRC